MHFTLAHTELRATDSTVDELGYHSANAMVTQIVEQLRQAAAQDHQEFPAGPDLHPPPLPPPPPVQEPAPTANAVVQTPATDPIMVQLLAQMQQMQQQLIDQGNQNYQNRGNQDYQNRGRGRGRGNRNQNVNRGNPQRGRRQYCWSHGSCAHSGTQCETQSEGYISSATFSNKQNGSTRNC